jgi:hypothetical protein
MHAALIPALERLRKNCELKTNLGYVVRPSLKNKSSFANHLNDFQRTKSKQVSNWEQGKPGKRWLNLFENMADQGKEV